MVAWGINDKTTQTESCGTFVFIGEHEELLDSEVNNTGNNLYADFFR